MHANDYPRPMPDDWRTHAACRGMDPRIFYPPRGEGSVGWAQHAKSICARCPVKAECLDDALGPPFEPEGIRGGLTAKERRNLRRRMRRVAS